MLSSCYFFVSLLFLCYTIPSIQQFMVAGLVSLRQPTFQFCLQSDSQKYLKEGSPDVLGVQETKCAMDKIPSDVKNLGFEAIFSSADKEGYAGTGVFSKTKPISVVEGIGTKKHDEEGRVITAEFDKFFFITACTCCDV